jgi:hypothetical protein
MFAGFTKLSRRNVAIQVLAVVHSSKDSSPLPPISRLRVQALISLRAIRPRSR